MVKFILLLYLIVITSIMFTDNKGKKFKMCPPNKGEYIEMGLSGFYERVLKRCNSRLNRASDR